MAKPVARQLQTTCLLDVAASVRSTRHTGIFFGRRAPSHPLSTANHTRFISLYNPYRECRATAPPSSQPRRTFTAFSACRAAARPAIPAMRGGSQPSMAQMRRKQQQEMVAAGRMPDDLGLIPVTMVMPTGRQLPDLRGAFRSRWRLEKKRARQRLVELVQAVYFHYVQVQPRTSLRTARADALHAAKTLYEELFTAFAANKLDDMQDKVCAGFLTSLRARIGARPSDVRLRWTLHRHVQAPRVVSYKAALLPSAKKADKTQQNGIQQVVVRLHTMQTLRHLRLMLHKDTRGKMQQEWTQIDHRGKAIDGELPSQENVPADAKESVEYFVVQRTLRKGEYGPWMAWGMTEETPLEIVEKKEKEYYAMLKQQRAMLNAARGA